MFRIFDSIYSFLKTMPFLKISEVSWYGQGYAHMSVMADGVKYEISIIKKEEKKDD